MIDLIEYVVGELKSKRLSTTTAAALVRQLSLGSPSPVASSVLHPLLHRNTSDLSEQRYGSTFTGEEFFLKDHQVRTKDGAVQKVLPGVAYLEMVRAAVEQAWPRPSESNVLVLRDTVWARPIVVSEEKEVSIALLPKNEDEIEYEIYSRDAGQEIVHCQGRALWSHQQATARLDLDQLKGQMGQSRMDPKSIYAAFERMGIFYGAAFQGIQAIYRGNGHALAHLRLPDAAGNKGGDYLLHPALMDSAVQACLGLSNLPLERSDNQPKLPFALDCLRIVLPCRPEMFAWVRYAAGSEGTDNIVKLDVDLCDEHGNVCAEIRGFSHRTLKNDQAPLLQTREGIATGLQLFVPVWNPVLPPANADSLPTQSNRVLLVGGNQATLAWVRQSQPDVQQLLVPPATTSDVLDAKLKDCSFDQLLWVAPDVIQDALYSDGDSCLIEQQNLGVLCVFQIIKALLRLGYGYKELRWTIITSNTQNVIRDAQVKPAHSGIIGLIGSLAKEYPQWNLCLLDVDSLESLTLNECLSMRPDKLGNGLAYRKGEWFRQEFAHLPSLAQSLPDCYRHNGVYVIIGGAGGLGEVWTRFMIENYQANVVWIGRRKYDAVIETKINSLAQRGRAPVYVSADASNLHELEQALEAIQQTYPVIHGVIHSTIVLRDQSIASMDETDFRVALSAKLDTSVNVDRIFGKLDLDFMLFFSSTTSFVKAAGQCNYAAGCTFEDSFAESLQRRRAYPIKVMNWGYWGKVGIVAGEQYSKSMERIGIGSIEPNEGMACLQAFMASELAHIAMIKTTKTDAQVAVGLSFSETLACYPTVGITPISEDQRSQLKQTASKGLPALELRSNNAGIEVLAAEILAASLASLVLFKRGARRLSDLRLEQRPPQFYESWLAGSISYLKRQNFLDDQLSPVQGLRALRDLWLVWDVEKSVWAANPDLKAQIDLLEACLKGIPDILSGKRLATDVIFPDSSMQLVEGVYRDNAQADYFNEVLRNTLLACIEQMRLKDSERKLRILEIGAGTGGSTKALLSVLRGFSIEEYCYTDVSKAFLLHAEEHYRSQMPALTTALFDVSKPPALQSIATGHYDIVIAANVLHATPNIRETLRNAKALLKHQGVLLLNEISNWSLITHLTFGLLEGWWLHQDTPLRLPGSPGLSPEKWREILREEGYEAISFPAEAAHKFGQQIIVGSSNGWVRQPINKEPVAAEATKPSLPRMTKGATAKEELDGAEHSLREKSTIYFQKFVGSALKIQPEQIESRRPLADYGLDSILVGQLTYQLRKRFTEVAGTLFFEVQTIDRLVDYFLENKKEALIAELSLTSDVRQQAAVSEQPAAAFTNGVRSHRRRNRISGGSVQRAALTAPISMAQMFQPEPGSAAIPTPIFDVAVIGLSGRYPRASNLKGFWANLANGVNCISEIPEERWDWQKYYDPEKGKSGKMYTKWGGFIDGIDQFDPLFFKISPVEAKSMDPQERLFLESCYHAIEDAGYTPENLGKPEKIGVFVGVMNSRYTRQSVHYSTANRVSYLFNFQGPSMAVDTACSASLTAIHLALESLYSGWTDCAIAGGVNLIIDPVHYLQLAEMTMLSSGNCCKAFGDQADGFIDGEGVGAVVLKPLPQAQADGDHILAIIKSSAVNSGGRTNGYTVPNPIAQAKVVSRALERAKIPADHVSYIEAHGTGTALGDPIEIAGLTRAFHDPRNMKQFCSIGSLKSNIGHCESAAGIAGLTKVLLQLKYEQLVPSLHAEVPNPEIDFRQTPFKVQKQLEPWPRPMREVQGVMQEIPRIAGVSSFGAGGANAHVIVQEYLSANLGKGRQPGPSLEDSKVAIVLSARSAEQLKQKARDLLDFIREEERAAIVSGKAIDLAAMGYTLQVGREAMEERLGMVVKTVEELVGRLEAYLSGEAESDGRYQGQVKRNQEVLKLLSSAGALQDTVTRWIEQRDLGKIVELWVKGMDVEWEKLYGEEKPKRMSLPVYPFAREQYWQEMNGRGAENSNEMRRDEGAAALHPMLHRNMSDLNEQRYSTTLNGEEFYLRDHRVRVDGGSAQTIMPGVAYLEMVRAAIEEALPQAKGQKVVLELRDIVWARPIIVSGNKEVSIRLLATESQGIEYEIYSHTASDDVVHGQGRVFLTHPQKAAAIVDLEKLRSEMRQERIGSERLYARLRKIGLEHGHGMKSVKWVERGQGQLLAELRVPQMGGEKGNYGLHPSLMDGALQAAAALTMASDGEEDRGELRVPYAMERMRLEGECGAEMLAWVRKNEKRGDAEQIAKLDIDLCDRQGKVMVQMRGLSLRPLSKQNSKNASKSDGAESLIAVPVWAAREDIESVGAGRLEYAEEHRIVCGLTSATAEELRRLLPQSQWLILGEEEKETLAERYRRCALACFERIQKILRRKASGRLLLQIVIGDRLEQVVMAGLVGMVNTARLENPQLVGQLIVAEEMESQQLAQVLEAEKRRQLKTHVQYRGGERRELRWEEGAREGPLQKVELGSGLKEDGVYLITGGLGKLGAVLAQEILGRKRGTRVIVTGRGELSAETQARLEGWVEEAGRVRYRQVDLEDEEAVKELMKWIKSEFGLLNGIVHCAGMIADNFLVKKTKEEFAQVLGPKVKGTYNLDEASFEEDLDFFVLFSSMAGAMGNIGQADYAAANGFMDRYAEYRNAQVSLGRRKGLTRSINWGLWKDGGMSMAAWEREALREVTGLEAMDTEAGIAGFYRSLALPYEQMLIVAGDVKKIREAVLRPQGAEEQETAQKTRMDVEAAQVDATTQMNSGNLTEKMQESLCKQLSELLQLPSYKIDPHAPLETYGMDSILALKLTRELEKRFGPLSKTLFFEYQNIANLARYFASAYPTLVRQEVDVDRHRPTKNIEPSLAMEEFLAFAGPGKQRFLVGSNTSDEKEIAIVGLAGRYPQAANLREFWRNLQKGQDCITEIPTERWDNTLYFDPDRSKLGKTYSKWGGFIADVDKFDPLFFNMSPKEAELIDPQERLFLETAWETIEDAGYSKESLSGKRVGVFVGVMWGQYELFGAESILNGGTSIPISSHASIANRVSYFFDFHGPSIALDTMCSSSMTAIYLACQELRNGTIDAAIVGGVNITVHPYKYLSLSQGKFAASDGKCRSFGEGGDGYVPGEGVGAVLIKPLEDALRDRDQVYAVIKSSTINHGGKTNGYTVPNPNAQGDLIREALTKARIDPRTLGYIETHGTGTSLGDPIEITGLLKAYEGITEKQFCPIGSVKSNIGHLESAAGIAAITKALLQLRYKQLVPSLHADPLNPNINFKDSPFYVQTELGEWNGAPSSPRRAAVSSFGAGGSNAHIILEEYYDSTEPVGSLAPSPEICIFSAKDQDALCRLAQSMIIFLADGCQVTLADLAYTVQVGRTSMDARLAIVASSLEDLKSKLVQWIDCRTVRGVANEGAPELEDVFTGNVKDRFGTRDLIEGHAGTAFLAELLSARKLNKIARLWIMGVDIDWSLMHRHSAPRKISLPTYPFAKERCWVDHKPVGLPVVQEANRSAKERIVREPDQKERTYYLPQWRLQPISAREERPTPGPILILDSSEQAFRRMKRHLESTGDNTVILLVRLGRSIREIEPNIYDINPAREEQFYDLVEHLKGRDLLPRVIVHHNAEACDLEDAQQLGHHLDNSLYALFYLCKALIKAKHQMPLKIISAFSSDSQSMAPLNAAIGGFLKTLSMENPRYLVKAVDIEKQAEKSQDVILAEKVNLIWDEIHDDNWTESEIRYRNQSQADPYGYARYINELVPQSPGQTKLSPLPLKPNGVYLITGGLGGLGLIFSDYLAKKFQARLVLVGRSTPNAIQQEKITQLKSYGAEVLPLQADTSNLEQTRRVIRETKAHFGKIDGVIHSAGVNRDAFILKKTRGEIDSVLASKVYGTVNLDLATSQESLDFFVMFSSVAGVMGNYGQSDYSYANHFMDSFTERRESLRKAEKRAGRTVSINWPLWEAGGMNLSADDIGLLEKRTGICPMPTDEGIQYWEDFLRSGTLQGVALYGIPSRIAAYVAQRPAKADLDAPGSREAVDMATLFAKTEAYLKALIGEEIKLAPERIGSSDRLEGFGIDSVMINRLNANLEKDLGALPKTLLYEHDTVAEVAHFLLQQVREALIARFDIAASTSEPASPSLDVEQVVIPQAAQAAEIDDKPEQIAIIGIHGYYPHSENLDEFWENLKQGKRLIDLVPPNRWNYEEFYDPDPAAATKGKIYCKWGGFLDEYDKFDPHFFSIAPEEARIMDPQERLFLESVWAAIEDAGYTRDSLKKRFAKGRGADVGVFVGVTTNSYHLWAHEERSRGNHLCPSAMPWSVANRVSYFFDFNGPSMPVDTACSSSLVAVHLACESLRRRECQIAIAGGVNLYLHPYKYQSLCQNRMLSPDGMCHSYGAGDDGFVPGEGVGTLVLKPLSKAIADHDPIHSIIRASAYDHSGRSKGYSAPNPNAQASVINRALHNAQVQPESVGCVEGHGTGTQLGDSLEVLALTQAFEKQTAKKQFCSIGSVKANIGHAESAAGMASLTKVVLQLQHRQLAPSLCSDPPNPNIEFEQSPFYLQHQLSEWESFPGTPRRALINSFGAGGVNACVILEEKPEEPGLIQSADQAVPCLFVLSARNEERLHEYVNRLLKWLQSHPHFNLASLCYTLQVGREAMRERLAMVVSNTQELIEHLHEWGQREPLPHIYRGSVGRSQASKPRLNLQSVTSGDQSMIEVASMWAAGQDVDWESLYPTETPSRISLPTYPFARERYWISDSPSSGKPEPSTVEVHPLISYNSSTLKGISFTSQLSDTEFYACDHEVNGERIFPGAGLLEMACFAGNIAGEQRVRKLKDVVWIHPLSFRKGPQTLRTLLKPGVSDVAYEISSLDEESEAILHSEGRLVFGSALTDIADGEDRISLEALKAQCSSKLDGSAFYDKFRKCGLNYGPAFQSVQEIFISDSFALAKLKLADHLRPGFGQFILHPSLVDGAWQTAAGVFANRELSTPYLPFVLDEVDVFHPLRQTCYAYAELSDSHGLNPDGVRKFNIRLVNESGDVLVRFRHLFCKALASPSPKLSTAVPAALAGKAAAS